MPSASQKVSPITTESIRYLPPRAFSLPLLRSGALLALLTPVRLPLDIEVGMFVRL